MKCRLSYNAFCSEVCILTVVCLGVKVLVFATLLLLWFTCVFALHLSELLFVLPVQDGFTALMLASMNGHDVVLETLLKGGATVNMQGKVLLYDHTVVSNLPSQCISNTWCTSSYASV